jgi:hypothetical protein
MRRQQNTVLSIVMGFLAVVLLVQLWLLVSALEAHAGAEGLVGLPAALASGACLLAAAWLVRSVQ